MTKAERERLIAAVRELTAYEPDTFWGEYNEMTPASTFEGAWLSSDELLALLATFGDDEERE